MWYESGVICVLIMSAVMLGSGLVYNLPLRLEPFSVSLSCEYLSQNLHHSKSLVFLVPRRLPLKFFVAIAETWPVPSLKRMFNQRKDAMRQS